MQDRLALAKLRALARRKGALALCLALCTLGLAATARAQTNIAFDAPGAGTSAGQGTFAYTINPSGTITGFTRDTNFVRHAFLRDKKGNFTIFDAPGAGTSAGQGTRAYGINAAGTITGWYNEDTGPAHGYVRTAGGTFTQFDAPDEGTGDFNTTGQGTFSFTEGVINNPGGSTGTYVDSNGANHGFVRAPDGTLTEFDPTGSVFTFPTAINSAGTVVGYWQDSSLATHGFLRAPDGTITPFDVPGDAGGTFPSALLPTGAIEGNWVDASGVNHGFVGFPWAFTTFDVSVAGTGSGQGTIPNNNPSGAISGQYFDSSSASHGFLRSKKGVITTFDAPGGGTCPFCGTTPLGINPSGAISGFLQDGSFVFHGFLYIP